MSEELRKQYGPIAGDIQEILISPEEIQQTVGKIGRGDATGCQKALKRGMAVALVAFLAAALLPVNLLGS